MQLLNVTMDTAVHWHEYSIKREMRTRAETYLNRNEEKKNVYLFIAQVLNTQWGKKKTEILLKKKKKEKEFARDHRFFLNFFSLSSNSRVLLAIFYQRNSDC